MHFWCVQDLELSPQYQKKKLNENTFLVFFCEMGIILCSWAVIRTVDDALDSGTSLPMCEKLIENGTVPTLLSSACWD